MYRDRLFILNVKPLRDDVVRKHHHSRFSIHPRSTKMYRDLCRQYWWSGMKKDASLFISRCLTYQQVKAEHQRLAGLLQPLPVAEWKWEHVTMDFVSGLLRSPRGHNTVWVVVDRLTNSAHFLPMKLTDSLDTLIKLFVREIIRLHGVSASIVSDIDSRFTSQFWQSLQQAVGTELFFSTSFHP